jgi:hypothetical protein
MKQVCKIAGAVAILFLMSIAPYLPENLLPEAQALRGRGAAFAVGAAVGSASQPAPAPVVVYAPPAAPAPAAAPAAAPPPQAAPAAQQPAK